MNHIPRHADATLAARIAPPHSAAFVQLHSGFCVDLMTPDLTGLSLTDLATGLSRLARFSGHTRGPRPYSVAQHSILVADILRERRHTHAVEVAGLMHDAHEALMGDITTPVKIALGRSVVAELERRLQNAMITRFGLGPMVFASWPIGEADAIALATERRDLMSRPAWPWPETGAGPLHNIIIEPWPETRAHTAFLVRAHRLGLR